MSEPANPSEIDVPDKVKQDAREKMAIGRAIAAKLCPYFKPVMLALVPRETIGLVEATGGKAGIGVTESGILLYDPRYIVKLTNKQMAADYIHETLHVWNKHSKRRGEREPGKWNTNADRANNPPIVELGLDFYGGAPMPKDIGCEDGLTAEEYYRRDNTPSNGGSCSQGAGKGAPQPGEGKERCCGSGAGNPLPGEPAADDAEGRTPAQLERAVRTSAELIREEARKGSGKGRIPAAWAMLAEAELAPPKIPWSKQLRYSLRGGVGHKVGQVVHRYDFPSRRQAGIGFGEGKAVLPRLRAPIPEVTVVLDTSGSMVGEPLKNCITEIKGILKAVGARVTFCVCDAAVHGIKQVDTVQQALTMLKGGGGTDFRPAFEAIAKLRNKPDVIVFLTDGWGDYPKAAPVGVRTIWVLVGVPANTPKQYSPPWGEVINVDDLEATS